MSVYVALALSAVALAISLLMSIADRAGGSDKAGFLDKWANWLFLSVFVASGFHVAMQLVVFSVLPADLATTRIAEIEHGIRRVADIAKPFLTVAAVPQIMLLLVLGALALVGFSQSAIAASKMTERGLKVSGRVYAFLMVLTSFTYFAGGVGEFASARLAHANGLLGRVREQHETLQVQSQELALDVVAREIIESSAVAPSFTLTASLLRANMQLNAEAVAFAEWNIRPHRTGDVAANEQQRPSEAYVYSEDGRSRRTASSVADSDIRAVIEIVEADPARTEAFAPTLAEMTPTEVEARLDVVEAAREEIRVAFLQGDAADILLRQAIRKTVAAAWSSGPGGAIVSSLTALAPNVPAEFAAAIASKLVGDPIREAMFRAAEVLSSKAGVDHLFASVQTATSGALERLGVFALRERLAPLDAVIANQMNRILGEQVQLRAAATERGRVLATAWRTQVVESATVSFAPDVSRAALEIIDAIAARRAAAQAGEDVLPTEVAGREATAYQRVTSELADAEGKFARLRRLADMETDTLGSERLRRSLEAALAPGASWDTASSRVLRQFYAWAVERSPSAAVEIREGVMRRAFIARVEGSSQAATEINAEFVAELLREHSPLGTAFFRFISDRPSWQGERRAMLARAVELRSWAARHQEVQRDSASSVLPRFELPGSNPYGYRFRLPDADANAERAIAVAVPVALALEGTDLSVHVRSDAREAAERFVRSAGHSTAPVAVWAAAAFPSLGMLAARNSRAGSSTSRPRPPVTRPYEPVRPPYIPRARR